jgi:hypothetical protein
MERSFHPFGLAMAMLTRWFVFSGIRVFMCIHTSKLMFYEQADNVFGYTLIQTQGSVFSLIINVKFLSFKLYACIFKYTRYNEIYFYFIILLFTCLFNIGVSLL